MQHNLRKLVSRSALQQYDRFTGWENQQSQGGDIFKQLSDNLNKYECSYSQGHTKKAIPEKTCAEKEIRRENKENDWKFPLIHSMPLNQRLPKKGSFLALKHRNILKEAMENGQLPNKPSTVIHDILQRKKIYDHMGLRGSKNILESSEAGVPPLQPQRSQIKIKNKNYRLLRVKREEPVLRQIQGNQFGDQKLIPICYKHQQLAQRWIDPCCQNP